MNIEVIKSSKKFSENNDYRSFLVIKINEKIAFDFLEGEPEDANLNRDFKDAYNIQWALLEAYRAGIIGEEFKYSERESDDFIYSGGEV